MIEDSSAPYSHVEDIGRMKMLPKPIDLQIDFLVEELLTINSLRRVLFICNTSTSGEELDRNKDCWILIEVKGDE